MIDENEIIDRLLTQPETYKSLLKEEYGRNANTVVLRRKILRNIHWGIIHRIYLNGSRGSEVLFTHKDKKYQIVISTEHRDFKYYYCWDINHIDNITIQLIGAKELVDNNWISCGDPELYISNVVKVL